MQSLTIYRPWWYRGQTSMNSQLLLDRSGSKPPQMCCLGQMAVACGVAPFYIEGKGSPISLDYGLDKIPEALRPVEGIHGRDNSEIVRRLMRQNDSSNIQDEGRETILTKLFAEAGIAVTFTDELPEYLAKAFPEDAHECRS